MKTKTETDKVLDVAYDEVRDSLLIVIDLCKKVNLDWQDPNMLGFVYTLLANTRDLLSLETSRLSKIEPIKATAPTKVKIEKDEDFV